MRSAFGDNDVQIYCIINAFKYLYRYKHKGGDEDIRKAQWYLDKFVEILEENDE